MMGGGSGAYGITKVLQAATTDYILDDNERIALNNAIDASAWTTAEKAKAKYTLSHYNSMRVNNATTTSANNSANFCDFFSGKVINDQDIMAMAGATNVIDQGNMNGKTVDNYNLTNDNIRNNIIVILGKKYGITLTQDQQVALNDILNIAGGKDGNINAQQLQHVFDYVFSNVKKDGGSHDLEKNAYIPLSATLNPLINGAAGTPNKWDISTGDDGASAIARNIAHSLGVQDDDGSPEDEIIKQKIQNILQHYASPDGTITDEGVRTAHTIARATLYPYGAPGEPDAWHIDKDGDGNASALAKNLAAQFGIQDNDLIQKALGRVIN